MGSKYRNSNCFIISSVIYFCYRFGIRVNAVLPGFIETPMTETVPDNVKQLFIKKIPLHRMGKPEEVAEVITFLASSKSSYINGASIEVTGGLH